MAPTSVILGQIELVGGDYRNRGRGEGGQLELPVEVGAPDFPVAEGTFEVHGAFAGPRGLGKLAQIGDAGGAGRRGTKIYAT